MAGCVDLLGGGDGDAELVLALGGPSARWVVTGTEPGPPWGLLWEWDEVALPSVQEALADDAWRVREMALKVVARHRLDAALAAVVDLQDDPAARVRSAASRALVRL